MRISNFEEESVTPLRPSFIQGGGALVIREGMLLLSKRKKAPFAGYWAIPVGHKEEGETYAQAVVREIDEETTLKAKSLDYLGSNVDEDHEFETHIFQVETTGEPVNAEPEKHEDLRWFPLDNLPSKLGSTTLRALVLLGKEL
jgi:ADP-ribose pyrophosphatase YjhB (NUDIX family)